MLIGHGGDKALRAYDMCIFETFPYSSYFDDYVRDDTKWIHIPQKPREAIMYMTADPNIEPLIQELKDKFYLES